MNKRDQLIQKVAAFLMEKTQDKFPVEHKEEPILENKTKVVASHVNPCDVEASQLLQAGKLEESLLDKAPVEKVAAELAHKDSSALRDIIAGMDPTGSYTFKNAINNIGHHTKHRILGDVGGLVGGTAAGVLLGAAGAAGAGKMILKSHPEAGKVLIGSAKDMMSVFHPKRAWKSLKSLGSSAKAVQSLHNVPKTLETAALDIKAGGHDVVKNTSAVRDSIKNAIRDNVDFKKKHGTDATKEFAKGVAIIGGGVGAGLGGAVNALSAHTQYNTALRIKKETGKLNKTASLMEKLASIVKDELEIVTQRPGGARRVVKMRLPGIETSGSDL